MGRRKKWLSKAKKALGSGHKKLRCAKHGNVAENEEGNVPALRRLEQEPDMLVIRTVEDDTVVDIPWSKLEEPYVVTPPVVQNVVSKLTEVGSEEMDTKEEPYVVTPPVVQNVVSNLTEVGSEEMDTKAENALVEAVSFCKEMDEETAAIMIQKAIKKYLAKRKLRDLRGNLRLKALMQGSSTKRQTATTLQCMQTLSRVQSQIRARRVRMSEENQALQRQLQHKHEKEMVKLQLSIGDDWNDSTKSKEKLEARLRHRKEAAIRRERALAYAHSFQKKWRNGSKVSNPVYMDPIYPHWGWSWLERWMAERPWESTTATDQPVQPLSVDEISKAYYTHRDRHPDTTPRKLSILIPQRSSRISTRPLPKAPSTPSTATRLKSPSCKSGESGSEDDDSTPKTICSVNTCKQQQRRHSIASSSMSHSISPRTVASAEAHRARLLKSSSSSSNIYGRFETGSLRSGSAKKSLPSPSSNISAARRHSGPPKVDLSSIKNTSLRS